MDSENSRLRFEGLKRKRSQTYEREGKGKG